MFGKTFHKVLGRHVRLSSFFGGIPFLWDGKTNRIYCTRRSSRKFLCFVLYGLFYETIITVHCINLQLAGDITITMFAFAVMYILVDLICIVVIVVMHFQQQFMCSTCNELLDY